MLWPAVWAWHQRADQPDVSDDQQLLRVHHRQVLREWPESAGQCNHISASQSIVTTDLFTTPLEGSEANQVEWVKVAADLLSRVRIKAKPELKRANLFCCWKFRAVPVIIGWVVLAAALSAICRVDFLWTLDLCDLTPCWRKLNFNNVPKIGDGFIMLKKLFYS